MVVGNVGKKLQTKLQIIFLKFQEINIHRYLIIQATSIDQK